MFTRVFAAVSSWAHSRGIRLLRYLDDWLILSSSEAKTRQHVQQLLALCRSLGIVINEEKSDLSPSRSVEYLGMIIDTVSARAFPTETRIQKFLSLARKFLSQPNPLAQRWQVLLGHMSSLEKLVPRARLQMRSLQWHLKSSWSTENDPPHLPVPRSRQVDRVIFWWMVRDHLLEGMPFRARPPPPELRLYSDASRSGWGAHLLNQSASGLWLNQETSLHINILEMKALFLALSGHDHQPASDSNVRQLHGGGLRQQAGGDSFRLPLRVDRATSLLDRSPQHTPGSEVPPGTIKRPRGSPQPLQPSTRCEVVPPPAGSEEDHPHLGVSDNRPIRNTPQREVAPVLLPNSRSSSRLGGRIPPPVESPRRVRISTLPFGREGSGQSQRDPKSL